MDEHKDDAIGDADLDLAETSVSDARAEASQVEPGPGPEPTPEAVVAGWMRSPGHRENILKKGFRWVGLGVLHDDGKSICGRDSVWATEIFYG